jgi:hypothetical protein
MNSTEAVAHLQALHVEFYGSLSVDWSNMIEFLQSKTNIKTEILQWMQGKC